MSTTFEDDFAALVGGDDTSNDTSGDEHAADGADTDGQAGTGAEQQGQEGADDGSADAGGADAGQDQAGQGDATPEAADQGKPSTGLSYDDLLALIPAEKAGEAKQLIDRARGAEHRLASDQGRQAALQRLYHEASQRADALKSDLEAANQKLAEATTASERRAAKAEVASAQQAIDDAGDEDLLGREYPELKKPVEIAVQRIVSRMLKPTEKSATDASAQETGAATESQAQSQTGIETAESDMVEGYTTLSGLVPDWQQAVTDPSWDSWISKLPAGIQRLADSNDPQDAAWLITKFKNDQAEAVRRLNPQGAARNQLKDHVAPTRGAGIRTEAVSSGATFEDHFASFANEKKR